MPLPNGNNWPNTARKLTRTLPCAAYVLAARTCVSRSLAARRMARAFSQAFTSERFRLRRGALFWSRARAIDPALLSLWKATLEGSFSGVPKPIFASVPGEEVQRVNRSALTAPLTSAQSFFACARVSQSTAPPSVLIVPWALRTLENLLDSFQGSGDGGDLFERLPTYLPGFCYLVRSS